MHNIKIRDIKRYVWIYYKIKYAPYPQPGKRHGENDRDPGTKSEGEEDTSLQGAVAMVPCKKSLGKTPNHLTLRYVLLTLAESKFTNKGASAAFWISLFRISLANITYPLATICTQHNTHTNPYTKHTHTQTHQTPNIKYPQTRINAMHCSHLKFTATPTCHNQLN